MNDRFKFRFWNKTRKIMETFNGFPCAIGDILTNEIKAEPYIVMQCTGLKDKNGKLIYERDIVEMNNYILQIVYNKDYACFCVENKNIIGYFRELRQIDAFEVIGNIYENKELLEG